MEAIVGWAILGLTIGCIGTMIGAGGGFLLIPILLHVFPNETAERITAISMAVVLANAASGSLAYGRLRRIDYASGWRFLASAFPGALLGAHVTSYITRLVFDRLAGITLICIALFLLWRVRHPAPVPHESHATLVQKRRIGMLLSAFVGFISSCLGIGGGIIHVPALIYLLSFPVHVATATSHFVLAGTSLTAVLEHLFSADYKGLEQQTLLLACGAVLGAQLGAKLSHRIDGTVIIRGLAIATILVGLRLILYTL